jgi:dephospho-CoA kinase
MLEELNAEILDADAIYHRLITPRDGEPSALARQIAARFPGVLDSSGAVDRQTLGEHVFANTAERRALEAITHPVIADAVAQQVEALSAAGCQRVIYDVPLLYERGLQHGMSGVIVVWVPLAVQVARLARRDRLPQPIIEQRIASQLSLDEKRRRATWVIDNSGDLEATRAQVEEIWLQIAG